MPQFSTIALVKPISTGLLGCVLSLESGSPSPGELGSPRWIETGLASSRRGGVERSLDSKSAHPASCDGDPPKLTNHDRREYSFELHCGSSTERRRIAAGETRSLKGKSGCVLLLGEQSVSLYVDLVCAIDKGKVSCELL